MSKKKKAKRHNNLTYAKPIDTALNRSPEAKPQSTKESDPVVSLTSYWRRDLHLIAWLAAGCVLLELVLWFLLQKTHFGVIIFGH